MDRKKIKVGTILLKTNKTGYCKNDICIGRVTKVDSETYHETYIMIDVISSSGTTCKHNKTKCQFENDESIIPFNKLPKEEQEKYEKMILALVIKGEMKAGEEEEK